MPDELPSNNDTESTAIDRKWLRIFIIVAIGIPVLLELSTLFNLVTVQFWGKSDTGSAEEQHPTVAVREFGAGDTLFSEPAVVLNRVGISVSPQEWVFRLVIETKREPTTAFQVLVDSLVLNSGKRLPGGRSDGWKYLEGSHSYEQMQRWEIPNGDIPRDLLMRVRTNFYSDSSRVAGKKIRLGPIPVRYDTGSGRR